MPLYDYECPCGKISELVIPYVDKNTQLCSCGAQAKRIVSKSNSHNLDLFKEERYEELGDDAPLISSKRQLARECEARGLKSRMLMDGYNSYGSKREI